MTFVQEIKQLAGGFHDKKGGAVIFTGAGMSTESGIPDFRSPGGIWAKYQPVYYADFVNSEEARHEYWRQKCEAHQEFSAATPNVGHTTLADWEKHGWLRGVITQNIDGLHQRAGNEQVLELHGTARQAECMQCHKREPIEPWVNFFLENDRAPECPACGGPLKHATISFGQALDRETIERATNWMEQADLVMALGSSLVVHPAAGLPELAASRGARLIIINRDPTPLDSVADLVLNKSLGETLTLINEQLEAYGKE